MAAPTFALFSHHKCATTWLKAYLDRLAHLNDLTFGSTHASREVPPGDIVMLINADYDFARAAGLRGVHIVRNPLSVIASAYFSHLHSHPVQGWPDLAVQRPLLQAEGKATGMLLTTAFLERADFHPEAVGPLHGMRSWDYDDPAFLTLRMEDLVQGPTQPLRQALAQTGAATPAQFPDDADFAFTRFAGGRQVGQIDEASHYRHGGADDWRDQLPASVVRYVTAHMAPLFQRFYPEALAPRSAPVPEPPGQPAPAAARALKFVTALLQKRR